MKVLLINNGTKHLKKLRELLKDHVVDLYPLFSSYPDPKNYDLIVLSGSSKFSVLRKPSYFHNEIKLILTSPSPIIGICEGCEIIARAYNSHLRFSFPKFRGIKNINVLGKYLDLPPQIKVYDAHYWAIKSLGSELIGMAKSERGFEMIKHVKKPIYGLMFHPEMMTNTLMGDEIFRKILTLTKQK